MDEKNQLEDKELEKIFSITPEELRDMLIKKHEKFLETYKKQLSSINEKKRQDIVLKKKAEILPDKIDLLNHWSKNMEENLSKINDPSLAQEIREKIEEYKKEKQMSEMEFFTVQNELKKIEEEISEKNIEKNEEWIKRRIESHERSLNFWKNYKTEKEEMKVKEMEEAENKKIEKDKGHKKRQKEK